jgi:Holliday junction resolvase RusA-like endonuclease
MGKRAIAWEAKRAFGSRRPFTGPVLLQCRFIFAIPPSWPKALRAAALEGRVWHVSDPDLDQLVKQVKDALKFIAYVDDNQVAGYHQPAKRYGHPERTEIIVEPLPCAADAVTPGQRRLEKRVAVEGWDAVMAPPAKRAKQSKTESEGTIADAIAAGRRSRGARPFRGFPRPRS